MKLFNDHLNKQNYKLYNEIPYQNNYIKQTNQEQGKSIFFIKKTIINLFPISKMKVQQSLVGNRYLYTPS